MQANLHNPFWMFQISSFPFQNSVVEAIRYLRYFAKNVIEERGLALHNGDETPNDILQHIVKGAQEDSEFDMDDMVDNFFTIFIAGIKTKLNVPSCCLFVCFSKNSHPASVTIEYVCNNQPLSTALFYFIRFANYWQGHPNSMTPITACGPVTVPPPMRDRPPHRGLRPLLFTNSACVGSLKSHTIHICKGRETGPRVYRPYPRRLESLTFADVSTKASLSPQLFKDPEC